MNQESTSRLPQALYLASFALLALRFLWLGDTVFILDEPFQQLRIDEHLASGTLPFSNARGSSIPVPYGPGSLWAFMLARLVSWSPVWIAFYHLSLHVLGALLFTGVVRRAYGREAGAWAALLAASSPLLFFFSRHPWDPALMIPFTALLLWQLQRLGERQGGDLLLHVGMGLVAGYSLNTHLMFGPAAIGLGLTLLYANGARHGIRSWPFWRNLLAFGATALAVLAPYLYEAARIVSEEESFANARNKEHWGDGRNLWWIFLRTTLFSSLFGSDVQLIGLRQEFAAFTGSFLAYFFRVDLFGWFGKLAVYGAALALPVKLLLRRGEKDLLLVFGSSSFFATLLVYQYLNIPTDPHYYNPIWWLVFVGIASAIPKLQSLWKRFFLGTLALTALVNTAWIGFALAYIHENRGARNMATSVVVGEQLRAVAELCGLARAGGTSELKVYKSAFLADPPLEYLPRHLPECAGIRLLLQPTPEGAHVLLSHPRESGTSARLVVEPAKPAQP